MALQHPQGPYARFLEQADEVFTAEGDRIPRRELPAGEIPVSYTHLTLPTKRIV